MLVFISYFIIHIMSMKSMFSNCTQCKVHYIVIMRFRMLGQPQSERSTLRWYGLSLWASHLWPGRTGLTIFPPFQSVAEFKNLNCKCCSTHSTLAPLSTFGRIQLQAFLLWSDPVIIGSVKFNLQIQWAVILQISEPCMNAYLCRPHTFSDS